MCPDQGLNPPPWHIRTALSPAELPGQGELRILCQVIGRWEGDETRRSADTETRPRRRKGATPVTVPALLLSTAAPGVVAGNHSAPSHHPSPNSFAFSKHLATRMLSWLPLALIARDGTTEGPLCST